MSSLDVIVGGEASSGESTDDERGCYIEVVARLARRPCPWVRWTYKFLLRELAPRLWICYRPGAIGDTPSAWKCGKQRTVRQYLEMPSTQMMSERDDVKILDKIQGGDFLDRIRPDALFETWVDM